MIVFKYTLPNGSAVTIDEYASVKNFFGKIVGGIYDDRLLVKPVESAIHYMPKVRYELPYDGAKKMLLVEEVDNREFLEGLFEIMYEELPNPKRKI